MTFVPRSLSVDTDTGVTLNGIVTRYESGDDFDIDGLTIRLDCSGTNAASQDRESIMQDLTTDAAVRLTGVAGADGAVHAWQLSTFLGGMQSPYADGEATVVAPIGAMDAGTGALTVAGFHVQTLAHTRFLERRGGDESTISAEDLQIGDVVSATGSYGGTPGFLIAESIARVPLQDPQITTYRFARAEPAITVLGRSILTTDTARWDQCGSTADEALLFGGDFDVYYLTIGLPALVADPVEASWVSIYGDTCQ